MADPTKFREYYRLADALMENASREDLAECVRLLALNFAHHQSLHGEIPLSDTLAMLAAPSDSLSKSPVRSAAQRWAGGIGGRRPSNFSIRTLICMEW